MADEPLLKTPGEMLAEARAGLGWSLTELSGRTKIPEDMLAAIERDEYHLISGALYVKSFLRTYAVEVGLEADVVLEVYSRFSGESTPGNGSGSPAVWVEDEVQINRLGLPWLKILIGAAAAIAILVVVLILKDRIGSGDEGAVPDPAGPVEEAATETVPLIRTAIPGQDIALPADVGTADESAGLVEAAPAAGDTVAADPVRQEPRPPLERAVADVPPAWPGSPLLNFRDGSQKPLVVRLTWSGDLDLQVQCDGGPSGSLDSEQLRDGQVAAIPHDAVTAGRPYLVREGFAAYWGADDRVRLVFLSVPEDLMITLNTRRFRPGRLTPGMEITLDHQTFGPDVAP